MFYCFIVGIFARSFWNAKGTWAVLKLFEFYCCDQEKNASDHGLEHRISCLKSRSTQADWKSCAKLSLPAPSFKFPKKRLAKSGGRGNFRYHKIFSLKTQTLSQNSNAGFRSCWVCESHGATNLMVRTISGQTILQISKSCGPSYPPSRGIAERVCPTIVVLTVCRTNH